ncbi:MAG: hypothetical protein M3419_03825 [Actinomycetota bacterium]|nr:hypothetical protein [Actinomycetota bacterium]
MTMAQGPHRVYIHIGAPKTGTTFLQHMLFGYREQLLADGVSYPADSYDDHFFAAVDLQDLDFSGAPRPEAGGAWDRLAARVHAWDGVSVVSHDVLAGATSQQARRAIDSFAPAEVHVVLTARDLGRQLPSHWQEDVKHGQTRSFRQWYDALCRREADDWQLRWFWRVEDLPDMLRRWGATLPPDRVHVVTVPHAGAHEHSLWPRFASVIGVGRNDLGLGAVSHPNRGLGVAEVALLRAIAALRDDRLDQRAYEHLVKGALAHETLERVEPAGGFGLPADLLPAVRETSRRWVEAIAAAGYDVVGDLTELLPLDRAQGRLDPDSAEPADVARVGAFAVYETTVRLAREREAAAEHARALSAELTAAHEVIAEHAGLPAGERVRRTVVEIGRTHRLVGKLLRVYRWLRRRPGD